MSDVILALLGVIAMAETVLLGRFGLVQKGGVKAFEVKGLAYSWSPP